jgi:hypothetical protein
MSQHNAQYGAAVGGTPPQNPYPTPLTITTHDGQIEDPEEWEYEYSTTETEANAIALTCMPKS